MGEGLIVRRGGSGKTEGSNVWSKNITETETCRVTSSLYDYRYSTAFKINLEGKTSLFTFDYLIGKSIKFKYDGSNYTITINSKTSCAFTDSSGTENKTASWDDVNMIYRISGMGWSKEPTMTKNIDFTITNLIKNAINFVVNDDSSAYPNGAVHTDGYYYELLGHVDSANVMSLSDNALETVQADYRDQIVSEVSQS